MLLYGVWASSGPPPRERVSCARAARVSQHSRFRLRDYNSYETDRSHTCFMSAPRARRSGQHNPMPRAQPTALCMVS